MNRVKRDDFSNSIGRAYPESPSITTNIPPQIKAMFLSLLPLSICVWDELKRFEFS